MILWTNNILNTTKSTKIYTQSSVKLNISAGIVEKVILGPYFFERNLMADIYLRFLGLELIPVLPVFSFNDINNNVLQKILGFSKMGCFLISDE